MNLILSLQAAYAAPIIMMSQNRQDKRERPEAHDDLKINKKSVQKIKALLKNSHSQNVALLEIHTSLM